ncbi:carbamoyl-phosphate synthase large subunit [Candidatus Manganitrophus noduliformans]|uniref:Carbamoyl phosphate synthase large chain n=1 Tax=Candidatus Manganitrophus noduliformans TaxID=2606439 RepID=A0A7X6DS40_9BACT|nr:carbamoyl-phosphate synthase large subunit [Candidatus Manganitrophus noduliformans]NKE72376.1 carbamoyl-phosphate synthase large subunit [Candidatus Manganitrophus noduliformans]
MPKRTDIHKILLIGPGPIVIGQACEFDYSGTQACKALREEGYQVILVNSNPATIMTDPEVADRTYIEPITVEVLKEIIARERPDALLPTMGGQTALNMAVALYETGVLERFGVELIGAKYDSIKRAEDREAFKRVIEKAGLEYTKSGRARNREEALAVVAETGFPSIIRSSFTLGGAGGSIAYNREEFESCVEAGLSSSPIHEVLIEQSVLGWKEFELEVMRDKHDNVVIICSIENLDPMGIHTGDSITVAPAQTLTDKEYQRMRDAAIRIIRGVGVDTGGSNIQFALNPKSDEMRVIEMNPRVSRSSALASKATGFPIAKIAAKLSVGLTLDEIRNDITRVTPASFEPTLDYVVVKIPRFAFEKFPSADPTLTLQMKSVGEVMAIGRNFKEALLKAFRSLEIKRDSLEPRYTALDGDGKKLKEMMTRPTFNRLWQVADALRLGVSIDEIHQLTKIDPWFLDQIQEIIAIERKLKEWGARSPVETSRRDVSTTDIPTGEDILRTAKEAGYSDRRIGNLVGCSEGEVRAWREKEGLLPVYKRVDTCGAEFEAYTPYFYSTYDRECEAAPTERKKVIILGSGPNRIGQGIEFDYCCVHAVAALKEIGYESIMVNCNPETVSTDYDTSDRLYFEPLTLEDVLHIVRREGAEGVVVQFGGQTPLKLAVPLEKEGVRILGTSSDAIDRAEDRERFKTLLEKLGLKQPQSGLARSYPEALKAAGEIGYPVMVRPSYVLGGRAMEVIYDQESLRQYMTHAVKASPQHPVLVDKYLEDAVEIDVDAVGDGQEVFVGGIMEHIEEAGVHSGDSACSLPPFSLSPSILETIRAQTIILAKELGVVGLMNVQFAVKDGAVYILEVNPRASRTIPFVSKTIGLPLAKIAMKAILGKPLREQGVFEARPITHIAVKEAVFPFKRLNVDSILGPEMKSTGEVMGIDHDFGRAFAKAEAGAENFLPVSGKVFISIKDKDKPAILPTAKRLFELGFSLIATAGTAAYFEQHGMTVERIYKVKEGRPHVVDALKNREIHLVINTVGDKVSQVDSFSIRQTVLYYSIPYFTTIAGAKAAVRGIEALLKGGVAVKTLQEYHAEMGGKK